MRRVEELHNLNLVELFFELFVLVFHFGVLFSSIGKAHVGVVLVAFEVTAEFVMRGKFGCVFSEFFDTLIGGLSICVVFLTDGLLFFTGWGEGYFLTLSIMGWKLVVSM